MLPLALDLTGWAVVVAGRGTALHKRLGLLDAAGAGVVTVYLPEAEDRVLAAGRVVVDRLPVETEIAAARLLLGAGLSAAEEARIGEAARAHRVLLNIEDRLEWCDFHVPALVRRGDLVIAVSTGGKGPAVAAGVRGFLERRFGAEWAGYLDEAAALRRRLRAEGKGPAEVIAAVRRLGFMRGLE